MFAGERERYFWGPLMADVFAGLLSLVVIIMVAMALGGLDFFAPWILVTPAVMLVSGFARGQSFGEVGQKLLLLLPQGGR
ncbi:MAG TPA: hypothetical protein VL240_04350 [Candidatus Binatia bacterium]|nr:hypothetical protein [Candidatus Binatia bacterium]